MTPPSSTGDNTTVPALTDENKYAPEGFESTEKFLKYARDEWAADLAYDRINREAALEDLEFLAGDQWDEEVKRMRVEMNRPCLTINVLPQFVGQVIGDRRMNKTAIKVIPKKNGSTSEATLRSAIIKGIEAQSRAHRVYDACCEDQVACGISNFRVELEYAANDVFEQDIRIRHIPNPLAVIWDRMSVDPTGRDARHCFVQDIMPRNVYEERFPDHPCPGEMGDNMQSTLDPGWFDKDIVRVVEFWEMIEKPATFALMSDGDVKDVTEMEYEEYAEKLWFDASGQPRIRESFRTYARMHLITGFAILSEEAYELPLNRLPVIRVEGRTVRVGDDRVRFGLVRFAKDSQRLKNYWRSVAAETLALAPKAQWVAEADAVEGREDEWRDAHISGDPLLRFNTGKQKPERVDPPTIPAALLQEAQLNQQDIKDVTGLHDASLGIRSNEVSGRAIESRKAEGDIATVIYHDNLNEAILEGGDVVNQLLPLAYDTVRQVLTIGEDDKAIMMYINENSDDDESPSISDAKYDVSLETGPSFSTQRAEAREAMTTLVQTAPDLFTIAGDLIVKAMDWPGAHDIGKRLHDQMVKQGIVEPEPEEGAEEGAPPEMTPEQMQQMQMMEAEQQAAMEHAAAMRQAELEKAQAEAERAKADAVRAAAAADREEAELARARADAERAQVEARYAPRVAEQKIRLADRAASAKGSDSSGSGSRPAGDRPSGRNRSKKQ
jgi:hypothetical protein